MTDDSRSYQQDYHSNILIKNQLTLVSVDRPAANLEY